MPGEIRLFLPRLACGHELDAHERNGVERRSGQTEVPRVHGIERAAENAQAAARGI